jgi:hypothetical protein
MCATVQKYAVRIAIVYQIESPLKWDSHSAPKPRDHGNREESNSIPRRYLFMSSVTYIPHLQNGFFLIFTI